MKQKIMMPVYVALSVLTACRQEATVQVNEPVQIKTMEVVPTVIGDTQRFSGTVEEAAGTPLSFSVMGTVEAVHFRLGERVEKGRLLASLDPTSIQSNHDAAKASLVQAEDTYRRMKELYDKGSLPEIKWVEAQSKLQQARAMEEIARKNLKDCKLYAPFDGVIADKSVEVGQNVIPSMAVGKLVDITRLKVKIAIPETEIASVFLQQKAEISIPALGHRKLSGTVIEKSVVADPISRSYEVKIDVTDPDKTLMPGMVTEVTLKGTEEEKLVVVPARIVQLDEQNRLFVWIDNSGKAEKRIITCGDFAGNGVIVTQGLNQGDRIIVDGQQKVCNGTSVTEI